MNFPFVSIVTPILKIDNYLNIALESILKQTFQSLELIIISDKNTIELFKYKYNYYINNMNIVFAETNILNSGDRRNIGISKALGKYILFLDADDYFFDENSISILVDNIEKYKGNVLGASCIVFNEKNNKFIKRYDLVNQAITKTNFNAFQNESGFYRFIYLTSFLQSRKNFSSLKRFQDSLFLVHTLSEAGEFYLIPNIIYLTFQLKK